MEEGFALILTTTNFPFGHKNLIVYAVQTGSAVTGAMDKNYEGTCQEAIDVLRQRAETTFRNNNDSKPYHAVVGIRLMNMEYPLGSYIHGTRFEVIAYGTPISYSDER